ncbi:MULTISPECIES: N-acetyl-gamma-glutamyl-phosphate reductase [unclassified Bacillus (in: firmicutes)]|uniref:N-acetyl-gamma-glutamyl-phosphate reductase n=1 Tax=unclassified Bacillus (in: firmicutes) TaxID=185979 RepID=UPI001BE7ADF5|nr:N-acetyl-gamma-glutamyl-phosphate reductase [Bacillus sp. ISL-39]MBT2659886.1 N-acetyl-gamma-glutamyl-phosphate reductase [Bacillus sp. ISL-45]
MKASIIGTTGYGGGELIRILANHPYISIHSIHTTREEKPVSEEYPHLTGIFDKVLTKIETDKIAAESDIVFLATPSKVSGKLVKSFLNKNIKVIDLSGDLRLKDASAYEEWYKHESVSASILDEAVYGLSEWNREQIMNANLLANPGCYPTAALLGLAPVLTEKLIDSNSIIIDAKSGVSGAGRSPSMGTLYAELNENFKIYKVNEHQHIPEIEQQLSLWNGEEVRVTFSTHLIPVTRGIMATIYVQLKEDLDTLRLLDLYKETYDSHAFIRVRKNGMFPSVKEVKGSNYCDIGLHADSRTGRLTIVSVIDNLMKGAAGQAVQNANIMFGLEESAGLKMIPLYP